MGSKMPWDRSLVIYVTTSIGCIFLLFVGTILDSMGLMTGLRPTWLMLAIVVLLALMALSPGLS